MATYTVPVWNWESPQMSKHWNEEGKHSSGDLSLPRCEEDVALSFFSAQLQPTKGISWFPYEEDTHPPSTESIN